MITYAGIGSRKLRGSEQKLIQDIAKTLAKRDFVVYSGNADGADIAFQEGSNGKCVIMLPWKNFNSCKYDPNKSLNHFACGFSTEGDESIRKFHPNPQALTNGVRAIMTRNWHQIVGYNQYPRVSFVIACADRDVYENIVGGTGQACRIAKDFRIPIFNIRDKNWKPALIEFIKTGINYEKI
jgi:hypothetical protein